jgi:hypothetical protein
VDVLLDSGQAKMAAMSIYKALIKRDYSALHSVLATRRTPVLDRAISFLRS